MLDLDAYQRKVDFYTSEWNLPKKPVSDYYNFKYLKERSTNSTCCGPGIYGWTSKNN